MKYQTNLDRLKGEIKEALRWASNSLESIAREEMPVKKGVEKINLAYELLIQIAEEVGIETYRHRASLLKHMTTISLKGGEEIR